MFSDTISQVLQIHKNVNQNSTNPHKVSCLFVDEGKKKKLMVKDLLELTEAFKEVPFQAIEVYICNVVPRDNEIDWDVHTNTNVCSQILQQELVGKVC